MDSQIARTSKGLIEYSSLGDVPELLLCHGTSGSSTVILR
jgi:hypothetical protein